MAQSLVLLPDLICIPWSIYNTVQLYKSKHKDCVIKRGSSLPMSFSIVMILRILANTPATVAALYGNENQISLVFLLNVIVTWLVFFFLNVRSWIIYYQYHWTHYTLQLKWQQLINHNILQDQTDSNWFIANNHKYGNISYICKLFGIIHFVLAVAMCIAMYIAVMTADKIFKMIGLLICALIIFPVVIFYGVIVKKTPSFNDIYYVYRENKLIARIIFIGYILFFISAVLIAYLVPNEMYIGSAKRTVVALINTIPLITWFCISYTSTAYIINNNKQYMSLSEQQQKHKPDKITLEDVLAGEYAINCFMRYLSREFNMENLLSFIEFTQFQQFLVDKVDAKIVEDAKLIQFPKNIPLSRILEVTWSDDDELYDIKVKAHELYRRYIAIGSVFEINISYAQRNRIIGVLGNLDALLSNNNIGMDDLFVIFDKCKKQLWLFLSASLYRFITQPEYVEMENSRSDTSDIEIVTSDL